MKIFSSKLLLVLCLITTQSFADTSKYLDNYEEEVRLFGVSEMGKHIDDELAMRTHASFYTLCGAKSNSSPYFTYDYLDKVNGDFSISYMTGNSEVSKRIGFVTNLWGQYYRLDNSYSLKFDMKTSELPKGTDQWSVQFVDDQGKVAQTTLKKVNTDGEWRDFSISLKELEKDPSFNIDAIKLCEFEVPAFPEDPVIKFDFIRFENSSGDVIGITDKTIDQRIKEQKASKLIRIQKGFEATAKKAHQPVVQAFAMMYLNQDLEKANSILREDCKRMANQGFWSLLTTPLYCRFYLWFSEKSEKFPGRLEKETEKVLLEAIWNRTNLKNDIHWARQSTWYLDGSENHDLNSKACNLVSSYIFMNEPGYKDRVYPDYGFGGGYHYGHAGYYGKGVDIDSRHGGGRANLKDGKKYVAKDHYEAWLSYMKEYFRERAKHGFFVENSSPVYSKHSMNMIDLAYAYSGDEELKEIIDKFMTLYWADWVQTGIAGISGGPKTRHQKSIGGYDSNTGMVGFYLGGPANGGIWSYWSIINGYELPVIVQTMALDREGLGNFVYRSRGIGEAQTKQPQPMGTERTLVINPESKFLKYSYVTPLYTLSTQMDHPWAVHSHLSKAARWHGMTVTQSADARVVPVGLPTEPNFRGTKSPFTMDIMYKTFQNENTLILQRCRSFSEVNPDWFPLYKQRTDQGVYIGNGWDERIEKSGWVFLREGDVYSAVRVVLWDKEYEDQKEKTTSGNQKHFHGPEDDATVKLAEKPYTFQQDGKILSFNDRYSPVIIQAGDKNQFGSFEKFITDVENASIALYKTVVPTFNILAYTPPGKDAGEMVFNAANNEIPLLNGEYISYELPSTYISPYIKSKFKSGVVEIMNGTDEMVLDFNN